MATFVPGEGSSRAVYQQVQPHSAQSNAEPPIIHGDGPRAPADEQRQDIIKTLAQALKRFRSITWATAEGTVQKAVIQALLLYSVVLKEEADEKGWRYIDGVTLGHIEKLIELFIPKDMQKAHRNTLGKLLKPHLEFLRDVHKAKFSHKKNSGIIWKQLEKQKIYDGIVLVHPATAHAIGAPPNERLLWEAVKSTMETSHAVSRFGLRLTGEEDCFSAELMASIRIPSTEADTPQHDDVSVLSNDSAESRSSTSAKRPRSTTAAKIWCCISGSMPLVALARSQDGDDVTLKMVISLHAHPCVSRVTILPARPMGCKKWLFESKVERAPEGDFKFIDGTSTPNVFKFELVLPEETATLAAVEPAEVTEHSVTFVWKVAALYKST